LERVKGKTLMLKGKGIAAKAGRGSKKWPNVTKILPSPISSAVSEVPNHGQLLVEITGNEREGKKKGNLHRAS